MQEITPVHLEAAGLIRTALLQCQSLSVSSLKPCKLQGAAVGYKKGQSGNPSGRKKGSKNKLTQAKDNLIKLLNTRLKNAGNLDDVSTESLIRFASAVMPKDVSMRISPDLQYVSQTPRPSLCGKATINIDETKPIDDTIGAIVHDVNSSTDE